MHQLKDTMSEWIKKTHLNSVYKKATLNNQAESKEMEKGASC